MKSQDIIDVVPEKESASMDTLFCFVSDIAKNTVTGMINGAVNTATDVAEGAEKLMQGDVHSAADIAAKRAGHMARGAVEIVRSGAEVTVACCDTVLHDTSFVTEENKQRLTQLCQAGITAVAASLFTEEAQSAESPDTTDSKD